MIIYNKIWLDNLHMHDLLDDENKAGCITDTEVKAIKEQYPVGFYMPGIFVRIGLFILTFIIISFSAGLLSLMLGGTGIIESFVWPLFLGIVTYIALEVMVKKNDHYRSGVDDALLWITGGFLTGGYVWMLYTVDSIYHSPSYLNISAFIFLLALYFTLRFSDTIMATITCLALFAIIFFSGQKMGAVGLSIIPFILMLTSAMVYVFAVRFYENPKAKYYKACLNIAQILGLAVLYAAGNYYIIDELSVWIKGPTGHPGTAIGLFFWAWTVFLPVVYISYGISKKNSILLRTGLVLVACAVATYRNYYYILPAEWALILAGIILLVIVYAVVKYLKNNKHGITYADTNSNGIMDNIKLESLIVAETLGKTPEAPVAPASRFGGGDFGGGGSSSNF